GYLWSFPRPDHLAVGIGARADCGWSARALRAVTRHWLDATGLAPGARLEPYGWPIPSLAAADLETERPRDRAGCSSETPPASWTRSPARESTSHSGPGSGQRRRPLASRARPRGVTRRASGTRSIRSSSGPPAPATASSTL